MSRARYTPGRRHSGKQQILGSDTEYFWSQLSKNRNTHVKETEAHLFKSSHGAEALTSDELTSLIATNESISIERSGPESSNAIIPMQGGFEELDDIIPEFCSENIEKMGYKIPTPIQRHAIPLALRQFDLMCCSQTGSGKTCAFLLPMIALLHEKQLSCKKSLEEDHEIDTKEEKQAESVPQTADGLLPQAIVLAPTRELACQILYEAKKLSFKSNLKGAVIYGGTDYRDQYFKLSFGCDILVATPGRLIDIFSRGIMSFRNVSFLVLGNSSCLLHLGHFQTLLTLKRLTDEADRMLDMGFEVMSTNFICI